MIISIRSRFDFISNKIYYFLIFCSSLLLSSSQIAPETIEIEVINTFPHDSKAFTQGLTWYNGHLYESTGLNGQSSLRKVDLDTGTIAKGISLIPQYFGEGSTIFNSKIYMITWKSKIGFIYDMELTLLRTFTITTDGWGLTHNATHLIYSDGTDNIFFLNPESLLVERTLKIQVLISNSGQSSSTRPVRYINELEYINGDVYANIWGLDKIAIIDLSSGFVKKFLDCKKLRRRAAGISSQDVLNGIAYDKDSKRLFLTGKNWPDLFEVKLIETMQTNTKIFSSDSKKEL